VADIGATVVVTAATVVVTGVIVGVIEDIGASAPTAIAMAIVRIVDMAQLVRPRATMAAAGLIHTTTHIRAFVAPLAGIMAPAASMALGSTVAGDTPTGDIAAATVAVCTGDGRSPCGAGTAGASPAAEDRQRLLSQASDRRRAGKLLEAGRALANSMYRAARRCTSRRQELKRAGLAASSAIALVSELTRY
jgi:hypothetical protein